MRQNKHSKHQRASHPNHNWANTVGRARLSVWSQYSTATQRWTTKPTPRRTTQLNQNTTPHRTSWFWKHTLKLMEEACSAATVSENPPFGYSQSLLEWSQWTRRPSWNSPRLLLPISAHYQGREVIQEVKVQQFVSAAGRCHNYSTFRNIFILCFIICIYSFIYTYLYKYLIIHSQNLFISVILVRI